MAESEPIEDGCEHGDAVGFAQSEHGGRVVGGQHRLFDEDDATTGSESAHQLLRALPDERPAEMAETDEEWLASVGQRTRVERGIA
jgi:hypothetical protein